VPENSNNAQEKSTYTARICKQTLGKAKYEEKKPKTNFTVAQ
jgi:hypothetical protein